MCQSHGGGYKLPTVLTSSLKPEFYHWKHIIHFLELTDSIHSFLRKYLPNTQARITIVWLSWILPSKKYSMKIQLVFILQRNVQMLFFFPRHSSYLCMYEKSFILTSHYITKNTKKRYIQRLGFNNFNNFIPLSRIFLSKMGFFHPWNLWDWMIQWWLYYIFVLILWLMMKY